jgi:hypothetical protein
MKTTEKVQELRRSSATARYSPNKDKSKRGGRRQQRNAAIAEQR